ncbi:DNA/RNA polymerases superfamily protein [Gossypium australe]|uniref:DNA/RNA polymerases superfamily protein n=1 Tax=Gossypium australe TaxID=47621 RepID=A0A5B6WHR2_9ROSI|nr:DNA/RNA polymerases superfamily protein [Gossypium australe]
MFGMSASEKSSIRFLQVCYSLLIILSGNRKVLTKSVHFIPTRTDYSLERLAELVNYEALGSKLQFSITFHPKIDGQLERVIQILEDMLLCCVISLKLSVKYKMTLCEALYGKKCKAPLYWSELNERKLVGTELIRETKDKVKIIKDFLKVASDCQKSYVDLERKDIEFNVGEKGIAI